MTGKSGQSKPEAVWMPLQNDLEARGFAWEWKNSNRFERIPWSVLQMNSHWREHRCEVLGNLCFLRGPGAVGALTLEAEQPTGGTSGLLPQKAVLALILQVVPRALPARPLTPVPSHGPHNPPNQCASLHSYSGDCRVGFRGCLLCQAGVTHRNWNPCLPEPQVPFTIPCASEAARIPLKKCSVSSNRWSCG